MSNIKEQIRQEIDTRRQHIVEELMGHEENCEYHRIKGMHDAYVELLTFLDYSLPEEKPSEDLEEAAEDFVWEVMENDEDGISDLCRKLRPSSKISEFYDALGEFFKAGSNWQKEQMMKDAVEGIAHPEECEIWVNLLGYGYKYKAGDKVRIIIVKED